MPPKLALLTLLERAAARARRLGLGALVDRAAPLVRHLQDCFGSDRTMWASNYPMDKACLTLPASIEILSQVLGADADLTKLLRHVARRTYRIEDFKFSFWKPYFYR